MPSRSETPSSTTDSDCNPDTIAASNYPNGKMSLSGISLRAFCLGTTLGMALSLTVFLIGNGNTLWRLPFFVSALSLFHFLEYFITARYNTRSATVSAYLLSSNGWAYNAAHGSAMVECLLSHLVLGCSSSEKVLTFIVSGRGSSNTTQLSSLLLIVVLGLVFMVLGQTVRSLAMVHAASNFNHHVQVEHKEGHVLVQSGVYRFLRHPSYFGFFWWGLGTQLILGNVLCFVIYAVVLWRFFSSRIRREFLLSLFLSLSLPFFFSFFL